MDETTTLEQPTDESVDESTDGSVNAVDADVVEEELLIEEVSIDGMCGVY